MTDERPEFRPAANIESLKARAFLLHQFRNWFVDQGYWECQTPILSSERIVDANIELFTTQDQAGGTWFLQSSPEACMKRLLAAGADAIFQIGPALRLAECGARHNPEFTIAEWYKVGDTYQEQMTFSEQLIRHVYRQAAGAEFPKRDASSIRDLSAEPFEQITYDDAFERFTGERVLELEPEQLLEMASKHSIAIPESMPTDRDLLLNLLLAELVEPRLGEEQPQFLCEYPDSQAALSRIRECVTGPRVALRFELYDQGVELCNGYQELTDAAELISRSRNEVELTKCSTKSPAGLPERLIAAMESGLPECSGVALGFDRLVMQALGAESISEVLAFPTDRA